MVGHGQSSSTTSNLLTPVGVRYPGGVHLTPMPAERRYVQWLDAAGNRRLTRVDTVETGQTVAIVNAVAAHSNAGREQEVFGPLVITAVAPAAPIWPSVFDAAELQFGSPPGGDEVRLLIPAPAANIFFPDGETVDPAQVGDVIAACVGFLRDPSGTPVLQYRGGIRVGRRR